ncbi:hypothetical protein [Staphylococcus felis]|uniref:Bacteriocin n=2 Tax=Staphylococcus felis TaxID=46127 RepID=A0ABS0QS87_9STAP|nr:hypothetical protein [Staphylococcus felis]MBH9582128.1 hypothetical protein [Staphylococcus felis]MDM8328653.1 hypothetical protein [Staphylococcus felis]MDQ7194017.1 hypothetical protein [Staphylococcus felis]QQB03502.1 hypothetical protein I6H71_00565 [Staphylococcus felis]UXR87401.1 hypothetical protein MUA17_03530 [Staphylococcus felis]
MKQLSMQELKEVNGGNRISDAWNATKSWFGDVKRGMDEAHEDNGWR